MAGEGRRFREAGYDLPKPQIDVAGKPMIERVTDCLTPTGGARFTLLDQAKVGQTQGAVDTLLHARDLIDLDAPLLVANCDQLISTPIDWFLDRCTADATVMTFNSTNPHHSYVKLTDGFVSEIAEKRVISDDAVLGIYWFRTGELVMRYAAQVIAENARHDNGEFYISALLARMIADGYLILPYEVDVHDKHMLGTPEELRIFLDKVADGRARC